MTKARLTAKLTTKSIAQLTTDCTAKNKAASRLISTAVCLAVLPISTALANDIPAQIDVPPQTTTSPTTPSVESVVSYLIGTMDTTAQAAVNPNFVGVQMTTCPVSVVGANVGANRNSVYLYQEQALTENLDEPYRQRFLQITPGAGDRIDSHTFKPDSPERWIGLCAALADSAGSEASAMGEIAIADLGERTCTVSLRVSNIGGYVGSTPTGGCATTFRGATSIHNTVVLHDRGMDTWDRGFDAAGNQVWGAEDIPYQYRD
ncbi:MAG: chromophore lyase CpcT/CpeT [Cyanobacteria bacterium J06632_3]